MGTSLTLLRAWASAGSRVKPSDTKIDTGWINGDKARGDWENERMYTRDTLVNAIATYLNAGVPLSDLIAGAVILPDGSAIRIDGAGDVFHRFNGLGFRSQNGADLTKMDSTGISVEDGSTVSTVAANSVGVSDGANVTSIAVAGVTALGSAGVSTLGPSGVQAGSGYELSALKKAGLTMSGEDGSIITGARMFSISLASTTWTESDGLFRLNQDLTIPITSMESRAIAGAMVSGTVSGKRWSVAAHNMAFDDSAPDSVLTDLWVSGPADPATFSDLTLNFWFMTVSASVVP